jgi:hypothetical protein
MIAKNTICSILCSFQMPSLSNYSGIIFTKGLQRAFFFDLFRNTGFLRSILLEHLRAAQTWYPSVMILPGWTILTMASPIVVAMMVVTI